MKSMKKKALAVLCTSFVASLALGVSAFTAPTVSADTEPEMVVAIKMQESATVRVDVEGEHADKEGIRFSLLINQVFYNSYENPVVGIYVIPEDQVTFEEMESEDTIPESAIHFYTANVENLGGDIPETENDTYTFNAVVYNIPELGYGRKLVANGYIGEADGEKKFASNPQSHSVAQAASQALANGDTRDGLTDFVDPVFADTEIKLNDVYMDEYKKTTPSMGAQLPEGYEALWTSSDEEIVTVDKYGELTFTGVKGEATITAKLGTKEATAKATYGVPVAFSANPASAQNIFMYDGYQIFHFAYADASKLGFEGEYTGGASYREYVTSQGYRTGNPYDEDALAAIKEAGKYTNVSFWFAVGGTQPTGNQRLYIDGASLNDSTTLLNEGSKFLGATFFGDGGLQTNTWYKITITLDRYSSCCSGEALNVLGAWDNAGGGDGRTFYFGDIFFEEPEIRDANDATILTMDRNTANKVYMYDGSSNYNFWYTDTTTLNFAGGYTGGATTRIHVSNNGYRVNLPLTEADIETVEAEGKFTDVSLWFAVGGPAIPQGSGLFINNPNHTGGMTFMQYALKGKRGFCSGELEINTWYKMTVSLEQFKACCSSDYSYFSLMGTWDWLYGSSASYYVGDIFFEGEVAPATFPEVITMTPDSASYVWIEGGSKFGYVDAASLGFAGDYTGTGAAKIHAEENKYYYFANPYTAAQLEEAKGAGYTKVAVWVAIDGGSFGDGAIWFRNEGPTLLSKDSNQAGIGMWGTDPASGLQSKTWYKFTVTIDQYSECCVDNYVKLMYINQYASGFDRNFYVGDIYFE